MISSVENPYQQMIRLIKSGFIVGRILRSHQVVSVGMILVGRMICSIIFFIIMGVNKESGDKAYCLISMRISFSLYYFAKRRIIFQNVYSIILSRVILFLRFFF